MSKRTEYRIMPIENSSGIIHRYLQFKHFESGVEQKTNWLGKVVSESTWTRCVWRFIPAYDHGICSGRCMTQESCPTFIDPRSSPYPWRGDYWTGYRLDVLENCARQYYDIEDYFRERRNRHAKYLKQKEDERRDCKIIYLSNG